MNEELRKQIDEKLPPDEELRELADLFKVFGDPTRLKILNVLLCSELCVQDIAAAVGMSESAVSHQLRILKQNSLIKGRREGKLILYSLADEHVRLLLSVGMEHVLE